MTTIGSSNADLKAAALVLAAAEGRLDGWLPAEEASWDMSIDDASGSNRWAQRLRHLMTELPSLNLLHACTEDYPYNLKSVRGRPAILFVDGHLAVDDRQAIAIVGSRAATAGAFEMTRSIAQALAERGLTVVSGLARGIDTAAHEGALSGRGRTIAVLGTGIGSIFPPENAGLSERIRRHGALISQFPPGHSPTKTTFPARNAVIAGMSLGSLVMTASERSGTRIEINDTLTQGRPVFLWRELLESKPWARQLAQDQRVRFVDSVDEITEALDSSGTA